ncbi:MAG TPA: hypothetical protein VF681_07295 [Abditibacteriaceae bacterium]|jgi:hypothetical protein
MNQALQLFKDKPFSVWVSLPRNDVELARAAVRGGAHGLKVHINVEHFASGTRFGSLYEERDNLARIVEAADGIPVGIVPGGNGVFASEEEFAALAKLGIDFFDSYPADAPSWVLEQNSLDKMLAAYHGAPVDELQAYCALGMTMCEASILPHESYGQSLTIADVARYKTLCDALPVPVMVPSQKKIVPRDVAALKTAGVRALLIGAIVTGREAQSIEQAARAFVEIV